MATQHIPDNDYDAGQESHDLLQELRDSVWDEAVGVLLKYEDFSKEYNFNLVEVSVDDVWQNVLENTADSELYPILTNLAKGDCMGDNSNYLERLYKASVADLVTLAVGNIQ